MRGPLIEGDWLQTGRVVSAMEDGTLRQLTGEETVRAEQSKPVLGLGVALGLRYGFVPPPYTLRENLYTAGTGEVLSSRQGCVVMGFRDQPPVEGDRVSSMDAAVVRLQQSVRNALRRIAIAERPQRVILMQSAGKDSTVIAKALSTLREEWASIALQPVTYEAGIRESESSSVERINAALGLPAPLVVRQDAAREMELMLAFRNASSRTVGDLALVPYLACLDRAQAGPSDVVIDGLGADIYAGAGVSPRQRLLLTLALGRPGLARHSHRFRWFALAYVVDRLDHSRIEQIIPGSRLNLEEVASAFPDECVHVLSYVRDGLSRQAAAATDLHKWRTHLLRLQECQAAIEKVRLACCHFGCVPVFPLASVEVTTTLRGLSDRLRFIGGWKPTSKPVFRAIVADLGHNAYIGGRKGSFRWNVRRFVEDNGDVIKEDIASCARSVEALEGLVALLARHRCAELRARKTYLTWNYLSWATVASERVPGGMSWRVPCVNYDACG